MKNFVLKHKTLLAACLAVLVLLFAVLGGALVGLQYFYEDFVAAKTQLKDQLGIVTEADLALLAAEEAAAAELLAAEEAEALALADAQAAAEAEAAAQAEADSYMRLITINGMRTVIDLAAASHTWFDAKQLSTEHTNEFTLGDNFDEYEVWFDGQLVTTGETVTFEVEKIAVNVGIELKLISLETGETTWYYIRTLHADYDTVSSGEGVGDGYYYFTQSNHIYKMDTEGNLVFFKTTDYATYDFKPYQFDGETYYVYMEQTKQYADLNIATSSNQTTGIVLDSAYNVIDTIETLYTDMGLAEGLPLDMHEFVMLGVDHYILCAYVGKEVDNIPAEYNEEGTATLATTVIQEVKDGELIFQWQSSDYELFYELNVLNNPTSDDLNRDGDATVDYIHFNSIEVDPNDNNFILSFRRISAVVKIDRETGDIIWVLGGEGDEFGLTDEQKFSRQHFARYPDSETITVFDNGSALGQTRMQAFVLDEETMTLVEYESYEIEGKDSSHMGSTMRLDDDALYLVAWGGGTADGMILTEIDFATGEIYFELMDVDTNDKSYRAYKYDY